MPALLPIDVFNGAVCCKLQRLWRVSGLIWPVFHCGNYVEGWLRKRSYWPWSTLWACGSSKQNTGFRKDNRPECPKRTIFFNLSTIKMPTGTMMSVHLLLLIPWCFVMRTVFNNLMTFRLLHLQGRQRVRTWNLPIKSLPQNAVRVEALAFLICRSQCMSKINLG